MFENKRRLLKLKITMSVAEVLSIDKLEVTLLNPKLSSKNMNDNIRDLVLCKAWSEMVLAFIDKDYRVDMNINYEEEEVIYYGSGNIRERIEILFHNILEEYEMYT